jgi:hypothetical protein
MKYFLFILVVFFSSIVFGQSGFNPPKITEPLKVTNIGIDTVRVLDSVRVYFRPIALHTATGGGLNIRFTAINIGGVGTWIRL